MKKIYLSLLAVTGFINQSTAQNPCSTGRYASNTFTAVTTTSVTYGSNKSAFNATTVLTMDIYQPAGDVETVRPLIVFAHGGSFVAGNSKTPDMIALCNDFAKKGFVCASINYRLGLFPFDSVQAIKALIRSVQDMKASVRFFYKDKRTLNTYKIDTNNIFIGGTSAGGIAALHYAYLKRTCQINPYITQVNLDALGGLDGYSGNQCYSSKVKGVINLCGSLGSANWIEAGDVPLCSMHGTIDGTVGYDRKKAKISGFSIMYLDGSRILKEKTNVNGVLHSLYTFNGADHVPFVSGGSAATQALYMDTTINFVRDFLVAQLGCTVTPLQPPNAPFGPATLLAYTPCSANLPSSCLAVNINEIKAANLIQSVRPNPSSDYVSVTFANANAVHTISLTDITGKIMYMEVTNQTEFKIEKGNLNEGMYFLKISNTNNESSVSKIIFN